MRRATSGFITTVTGIGAIGVGLAIIDERVRTELAALATGHLRSGELAGFGERIHELGVIALQAIRDQSMEHAPLTAFAVVALVLFALMLRT